MGDANWNEKRIIDVVHSLITTYQWTVLPAEKLATLVANAMRLEDPPDDLNRFVIARYTIELYNACRQADDLELRERGYTDLFHYVYRAAYQKWPDLAEDATQRALLLVYQQIERCANPVAFRSFALFKLRQAVTDIQRRMQSDQPLEVDGPGASSTGEEALEDVLMKREDIITLLDALKRLPHSQRQAIFHKFFDGLGDDEIAGQIGTTAGHVRVLRCRGLERLRQDPALRIYFEPFSSERL